MFLSSDRHLFGCFVTHAHSLAHSRESIDRSIELDSYLDLPLPLHIESNTFEMDQVVASFQKFKSLVESNSNLDEAGVLLSQLKVRSISRRRSSMRRTSIILPRCLSYRAYI